MVIFGKQLRHQPKEDNNSRWDMEISVNRINPGLHLKDQVKLNFIRVIQGFLSLVFFQYKVAM
jgi:hypothetical protein